MVESTRAESFAASFRPLELVVFDWDGTLMDSTAMIVSSIQLACADVGVPVPSRERASHVIGLGLHDALARAVPGIRGDQVPQLADRYRHHYLGRDQQLVLFDGVRELLVALKERGHRLAVATGKSRTGLNRALNVSGLGTFFEATRCADECHSKPNPEMLLELMAELDVEPARTIMIGDTTHDLLMAANAGTHGLGVEYGAHPGEDLRAMPSRGVVSSVEELHSWLFTNG
jgi:phosphoglycolate phosphatase